MSAGNPLTISASTQIAAVANTTPSTSLPEQNGNNTYGEYTPDVVKISQLGRAKQQQDIQLQATQKIKSLANEVVSVTSSIGESQSAGHLTQNQATELYHQIAALL